MAQWYYCETGHAPVFLRHPDTPPACTQCRAATVAAHDVVRLTVAGAGAYELKWHANDADESPMLKLVATVGARTYSVLIDDDMLAYDSPTASLSANTTVSPPGGGRWVDSNLRNHGGGTVGRSCPAVPAALAAPVLKLGRHGGGAQHGLIHILHRHANMFNNMASAPALQFNLTAFRDNLRAMTGAPTGAGSGARQIAKQANNNVAIHGVANSRRAMLVIDPGGGGKIKTCWSEQNRLGGLGQRPTILRRW